MARHHIHLFRKGTPLSCNISCSLQGVTTCCTSDMCMASRQTPQRRLARFGISRATSELHGVTADTTATFGPVWDLQGDERAAWRHGGHHCVVGGGWASPGRRGSDLFRRGDGYGVCQSEEGSVCLATRRRVASLGGVFSTECGNLLSNNTARMSR
jgi:hypothetical protein